MSIEEVELEDIDYLFKFTERLYKIMTCINGGIDITEEDYCVLEEVHRICHEGNLPFYKTICNESATTTTQTDLFANTSDTIQNYPDGTQFDYTVVNNKNDKK